MTCLLMYTFPLSMYACLTPVLSTQPYVAHRRCGTHRRRLKRGAFWPHMWSSVMPGSRPVGVMLRLANVAAHRWVMNGLAGGMRPAQQPSPSHCMHDCQIANC